MVDLRDTMWSSKLSAAEMIELSFRPHLGSPFEQYKFDTPSILRCIYRIVDRRYLLKEKLKRPPYHIICTAKVLRERFPDYIHLPCRLKNGRARPVSGTDQSLRLGRQKAFTENLHRFQPRSISNNLSAFATKALTIEHRPLIWNLIAVNSCG